MSNVFAFPLAEQAPAAADPCYGLGHRMLTLEQVCEWLNVTERHVRKLVERDAIPYRKVGRLLRFSETEIDEWTRPTHAPHALAPSQPAAGRPAPKTKSTSYVRISMSQLAA